MRRLRVCLLALLPLLGGGAWAQTAGRLEAVYRGELGVREATGRNDGARVRRYLQSVGMGEGAPWCAAFVSWCLREAGVDAPMTAWSPALFPHRRVVYRRGAKAPGDLRRGDVFGIYYRRLGRIGHVGFVEGVDGAWVTTVEGNTNRRGSREGDGVYRKRRPLKQIHRGARYAE